MLYQEYPKEAEGLLAKRFVALTCGKTLAKVAIASQIKEEMLPFVEEAVNAYGEFIPGVKECLMEESFNCIKNIMMDIY